MLRRFTFTTLLFMLLVVPSTVAQTDNKPAKPASNDYSKGENWLCRPGRQDACAADLTTTIVEANCQLKE